MNLEYRISRFNKILLKRWGENPIFLRTCLPRVDNKGKKTKPGNLESAGKHVDVLGHVRHVFKTSLIPSSEPPKVSGLYYTGALEFNAIPNANLN